MPAGRAAILSKPNVINPGLALLQNSTLWLDASDMAQGAQWVRNKGTGGRALDARLGSVGSAQVVGGVLKLPGITGNYASVPDSAALDITDDIEIVAKITVGSISTNQEIVTKWATGQWSYTLRIESANLVIYFSSNGSGVDATYSIAHGLSIGDTVWIKGSRVRSSGLITLSKAADSASEPTSWTTLGSVTGGTLATFVGTAPLRLGQDGNVNFPFTGSIHRAIVRNSIGGTPVLDVNFATATTLATSFTESSSNAATVTINSTFGVDTNDPLTLTHSNTNYLYLPGTAGNVASTPDSTALDLTGDLELVCRFAPADATPVANMRLISKRPDASSGNYEMYVGTTGTMGFAVGSGASVESSAADLRGDGVARWWKVTYTNGGSNVANFYTADDQPTEPTSWTQLGAANRAYGAFGPANTSPLFIGSIGTTLNPFSGNIFRAIVRNGIGGTAVFDADFTTNTNQNSFIESSSNGATVTINRSTSGRKAAMVTRPVWLFGTDDYMEIPNNPAINFNNTSFTAMVVTRGFGTPGAFQHIFAHEGGSVFEGWSLIYEGAARALRFHVGDGVDNATNNTTIPTLTAGAATLVAGVWNESDGTAKTYHGVTLIDSDTSTPGAMGNIAATLPLRLGWQAYGTGTYADVEILGAAVFPTALTSVEIGQIASYLGVL